jgi:hypothetical protein
MKPETRKQFRKDFAPVKPSTTSSSLGVAYQAVGSKTDQQGVHRPLQFSSQGANGKLRFEVNMAKCKWRPS